MPETIVTLNSAGLRALSTPDGHLLLVGVAEGAVGGSTALLDNEGTAIYPNNYPQFIEYNEDGTVNFVSFSDGTNTWTQTLVYNGGKLSSIGQWVKI